MKKILFFLLISVSVNAQISTRCKVCPPSLEGVPDGYVLRDSSGYARWQSVAGFDTAAIGVDSLSNLFWGLNGNSGNNSTNFIGTTDNTPFTVKTNSVPRIEIDTFGNVEIVDTLHHLRIGIKQVVEGFWSVYGSYNDSLNEYSLRVNEFSSSLNHEDFTLNKSNGVHVSGTENLINVSSNDKLLAISNTDEINIMSITRIINDSTVAEMAKFQNDTFGRATMLVGDWQLYADSTDGFRFVYGSDTIAKINPNGLVIPNGAGDGKVLTSDADGNASWQTLALTDTATLDFGIVTQHISSDLTITVTGAANGDVVSLGVDVGAVEPNLSYFAFVSATNTVTVRALFTGVGTVDPDAGLFKVKVFK